MTMSGNDFRLYAGVDFSSEFLAHYGVGHLDGGNSGRYKWGSGKNPKQREGSGKRVFVSGSSKTQDKESGYYRRKLPKDVRAELDAKMKNGDTILVGDAPGIDRQVQDYLKKKHYKNVEVFSPGYKDARYIADKKHWYNYNVDVPWAEEGSPEWLAGKDKVMAEVADEGIAVILDNGAAATRKNVGRLFLEGKDVSVYELSGVKEDMDRWVDQNGKEIILDTYRKDGKDEYQFYRSNIALKELALDYEKEMNRNRWYANEALDYTNDSNVDLYVKLQSEIYNRSINLYEDEPKSERAKAVVEYRDNRIKQEVDPLEKKLIDMHGQEKLRKVHDDADAKASEKEKQLKASGMSDKEAWEESFKLYQGMVRKFENGQFWKSYKKALDEVRAKEREISADFDEKIAKVILQDLGFAVTDENLELLDKSRLMFIS